MLRKIVSPLHGSLCLMVGSLLLAMAAASAPSTFDACFSDRSNVAQHLSNSSYFSGLLISFLVVSVTCKVLSASCHALPVVPGNDAQPISLHLVRLLPQPLEAVKICFAYRSLNLSLHLTSGAFRLELFSHCGIYLNSHLSLCILCVQRSQGDLG